MSCPAICAKGPSRRKPVRRAIIRRGFATSRSFGSSPIDSSTPGRKGSTRTSEWLRRDIIRAMPSGDLRSRAMEGLWYVKRSGIEGGGSEVRA